MSHRRREALGRNRGGPSTRNTVPLAIIGCVLMAALAVYAYRHFASPQRVFGAKQLDCSAGDITWQEFGDGITVVRGCGRSVEAVCEDGACVPPPPSH